MEVHHHPDLHHKPKPWKEYFLEFVMIFLAVTLGFFAESLREYRDNRAMEKDYVKSLINVLRRDTSDMSYFIEMNEEKLGQMDTLRNALLKCVRDEELYNSDSNKTYLDDIYIYGNRCIGMRYIFPGNNSAIVQIKSFGGFRLIQRAAAADSIADYDISDQYLQANNVTYVEQEATLYDTWSHTFDMSYLRNDEDYEHLTYATMLVDRNAVKYFYNKVSQRKSTIKFYINNELSELLEKAKRLIVYLKKVYHIS